MCLGDPSNIARPVFPVVARPALLYNLRLDRLREIAHHKWELLLSSPSILCFVACLGLVAVWFFRFFFFLRFDIFYDSSCRIEFISVANANNFNPVGYVFTQSDPIYRAVKALIVRTQCV